MALDAVQIILWFVLLNASFSIFAAALDRIKDLTATKLDNRIASFFHKSSKILRTSIDVITGNMKH